MVDVFCLIRSVELRTETPLTWERLSWIFSAGAGGSEVLVWAVMLLWWGVVGGGGLGLAWCVTVALVGG